MELYTETLPASLPSTDITGAISAFVHAHMCECVLILPSGFAKETLLEDRSTSRYDTEKPQRLESDSGWYSRERDAIQRDMDRLDRALGHGIKGCAAPGSASSSSLVCLSSRNELCLLRREMSCCRPCPPRPCGPCGPTPLASSCSEPCVARCADSTVYIEPSPVVVTMPGPILTSFPQSTAVGSSLSAAVGSSLSSAGVPISSGGSLGLGGSGLCLPSPRCGQIC
ncbi:uncharacterized protein LOC116449070 [Corvus moneduloides]|uniref:uncharacterized protein LOC116449018 n=1 Tax=Corvus moneduloides TaxID=1196302 RepID=UPI00136358BE|nr:uncharacterized protein LOC116449018 [Corvus moneduloides]XP_031976108.1 uncharacterized protein LOC116449058 [Corvus moneduloides]XP_031976119.1 uncharacterized protein LOC116449070 [Corvus moneduloides]